MGRTKKHIAKKRQSHKQKHMRHKTKKNKSKGFLSRLFGRRSRKGSDAKQRKEFLDQYAEQIQIERANKANEQIIKDFNLDKSLSPTPPVDKSTFNPYLHARLENKMKKLHEERRQRKKSATRKYNKRKQSSHRKSTLKHINRLTKRVKRLTSQDVKKKKDEINNLAERDDMGIHVIDIKVKLYEYYKKSKNLEIQRKAVHLYSQLKNYYHHKKVKALYEDLMKKNAMRKVYTSSPQKDKETKKVLNKVKNIVDKPKPVVMTPRMAALNRAFDNPPPSPT